MSRNGSGTYTIPNTFLAGQTITASSHNANWSDMGAEMTNSVAADGQTTMTGPLKAATGTATAPSITFGGDTNTGIYRSAADEVSISVGGTQVAKFNSSGLDILTGLIRQSGLRILPVGLGPLPWSGFNPPSQWVLANGQTLSRTTYADLWAFAQAEIGFGNNLWGSGDGTSTFTVPDMRGRVPAGQDNMGGSVAGRLTSATISPNAFSLGNAGGGQTQNLTVAQLPTFTPSGSISRALVPILSLGTSGIGAGGFQFYSASGGTNVNLTGADQTFTGDPIGGGGAHGNVQPTIITTYIIFAGI